MRPSQKARPFSFLNHPQPSEPASAFVPLSATESPKFPDSPLTLHVERTYLRIHQGDLNRHTNVTTSVSTVDVRISPDKKRQTEKQAATTPRHWRQSASAATAPGAATRTPACSAPPLSPHSPSSNTSTPIAAWRVTSGTRTTHKCGNRLLLCNRN